MIRSLVLWGAGMLSMAAVAAPSIHIGAMYDYLEDNRSTLLKRIRNSGDSTAFVRVSITEVSFGETGEPQEKSPPPSVSARSRPEPRSWQVRPV